MATAAGQRGSWLDALPYFYLARVQLLTLAALVAMPFAAIWLAPSLMKGIFDVDGTRMILVALAASLASWSVMLTTRQVLHYGPKRFGVARFPFRLMYLRRPPGFRVHGMAFLMMAAPVIAGAIYISASGGSSTVGSLSAGAGCGVAIAAVVAWCVTKIRAAGWGHWSRLGKIFVWLGDGYAANKTQGYAGHYTAFWSFVICLAFYAGIGIAKGLDLGSGTTIVPTLADLLVYVMILCWALAGITFFFDKWRVPLLLLFVAWTLICSVTPWTDHFFKTVAVTTPVATIKPEDIFAHSQQSDVILVAASGGGIKAAGWTTRVLTGLANETAREIPDDPGIFGRSVRLISAVSGGSVGAMYFVDAYRQDGSGLPTQGDALNGILAKSEKSSLDEIAWGLVYPDFLRVFLPGWHDEDRGAALEKALIDHGSNGRSDDATLSKPLASWRAGVLEGSRPAVIFNATVVESGERMLLGTTDLPKTPIPAGCNEGSKSPQPLPSVLEGEGRTDLVTDEHFMNQDISIATAVRLSAAFPYVSPASRPDKTCRNGAQIHIVDGGYTDNFGMATLLGWLEEALKNPSRVRRVLIIEIRAAGQQDNPTIHRRAWPFQMYAPLSAMLDVRDTGQLPRNVEELDLLERETHEPPIEIEDVTFTYQSKDAPLSWHLSPADEKELNRPWDCDCPNRQSMYAVMKFLNSHKVPAAGPCLPPSECLPCVR